jgi:aspartyl protease family protein
MVGRLLFIAIAFGTAIGLILPNGAPRSASAEPKLAVATVTPPQPAPQPPASPYETVLDRKPDGHFYLDATVNGQLVHFVVDTGASAVILTSADAQRVGLNFSRSEFTVIGRGASGDVAGKPVLLDRIAIGNNEVRDVRGAIAAEGLDVSLLGQSFLSRIGTVTIRDDRMVLR